MQRDLFWSGLRACQIQLHFNPKTSISLQESSTSPSSRSICRTENNGGSSLSKTTHSLVRENAGKKMSLPISPQWNKTYFEIYLLFISNRSYYFQSNPQWCKKLLKLSLFATTPICNNKGQPKAWLRLPASRTSQHRVGNSAFWSYRLTTGAPAPNSALWSWFSRLTLHKRNRLRHVWGWDQLKMWFQALPPF